MSIWASIVFSVDERAKVGQWVSIVLLSAPSAGECTDGMEQWGVVSVSRLDRASYGVLPSMDLVWKKDTLSVYSCQDRIDTIDWRQSERGSGDAPCDWPLLKSLWSFLFPGFKFNSRLQPQLQLQVHPHWRNRRKVQLHPHCKLLLQFEKVHQCGLQEFHLNRGHSEQNNNNTCSVHPRAP